MQAAYDAVLGTHHVMEMEVGYLDTSAAILQLGSFTLASHVVSDVQSATAAGAHNKVQAG